MTQVPYSALNESQREQVAYIFADKYFGRDASAYLYELDKSGAVTRRSQSRVNQTSTARVKAYRVGLVPAQGTQAEVDNAMMHMDALAASVAEKLYQSTLEEVTP